MKSKKQSLSPQDKINRAKHMLTSMAERAIELADRLTLDGTKLDIEDRRLYNQAHLPILDAALDQLRTGYVSADPHLYHAALDEIHSIKE